MRSSCGRWSCCGNGCEPGRPAPRAPGGGSRHMKQVVFVTRKLPEAVEERLRRDYEPRLNPDDRQYASEELIQRAAGAAAILPCHTERFSAEVIPRLPESVRIIANFSVG